MPFFPFETPQVKKTELNIPWQKWLVLSKHVSYDKKKSRRYSESMNIKSVYFYILLNLMNRNYLKWILQKF